MDDYRPRFPESPFLHLPDFVNPKTGRTFREDNEAKEHGIPVGALVEIIADEEERRGGVRLYVVHHHRDCDGTPLYAMAFDKTDTEQKDPRFHNPKWLHGFPEESLLLVPSNEPRTCDGHPLFLGMTVYLLDADAPLPPAASDIVQGTVNAICNGIAFSEYDGEFTVNVSSEFDEHECGNKDIYAMRDKAVDAFVPDDQQRAVRWSP